MSYDEIRKKLIDSGTVDIKLVDGVVTIDDPNNPINGELREWLEHRGIDPDFYIEEEAKQWVLNALKDPYFEKAYIDEENGLVIEFSDEILNGQALPRSSDQ